MRKIIIKIGAYLTLALGILLAIVLAGFAIYSFVAYPETAVQKRAVVGTLTLVLAAAVLLISIAIFESMLETIEVGNKLSEKNHTGNKTKSGQ